MEALFLRILNMSVSASFVILAVLLARLLLRRTPRMRFLLWVIVAVRLLIPFTIPVLHSPVPVRAEPIAVDIGMVAVPEIDTGIPALDGAVNSVLPPAAPEYSANPMQIAVAACTVLWLSGAAVLLVIDVVSLILLRLRLRGAAHLRENVWLADRIPSPFVWGILRPRIYVPSGTPETYMSYILAHERAHIRRGDPVWKLIGCAVLTLHWFNPLVWIAYTRFVSDMEAACDEAVLRGADGDIRCAYGEALLSVASGRNFFTALPPAFGESDPKRRIKRVLQYTKAPRWAGIAAAALTVLVTVGCAFSLAEREEAPENAGGTAKQSTLYDVTFPAYSDARSKQYTAVCSDTAPFTVTLELPDGWTVGAPKTFDAYAFSPVDSLISPVCFYLDGELTGSMGFYPIENDLSGIAPEREYFLACHPLMFGNYNSWDNDYTEVKAEGTYKVGTCHVGRRLDAVSPESAGDLPGAVQPVLYTQGITAYDTELLVCVGIEFSGGILTDGAWREIAESISIHAGAASPAVYEAPTMQTAKITFPAYQGGRTAYNAFVYDTEPFTLTMQIPVGWHIVIPAVEEQTEALPYTPLGFYYGTEYKGSVGFMPFELYEGVSREDGNFYRMVYNQLMLGNVVTWDCEYTPVFETETFCAATCKVDEPLYEEGKSMAEMERIQRPAIVAYDTEMLVYVAMSFADDAVTEAQWLAMAQSVRLSRE